MANDALSFQDDTEKAVKLTSRERRFIKFASVEFDGQLYMTPQDFLDSVVEQEARRKQHPLSFIQFDLIWIAHLQRDWRDERLPWTILTNLEITRLRWRRDPHKCSAICVIKESSPIRNICSYCRSWPVSYAYRVSITSFYSFQLHCNIMMIFCFQSFRTKVWIQDSIQHVRYGWQSTCG